MITAILNCYRRPQNLQPQIKALINQTVPPEEIWVWKNYHPDQNNFDWTSFNLYAQQAGIRVIESNYNWKYCGRFAAACLVDTEFTAIFDDDTIPGPRWFENCLDSYNECNGIYGGVGVCLNQETSYQPNTRYGWVSGNQNTVEVDLVGHAWFFPSSYIKYMWMEKPMWANGEDMHFSAMCQIHGNIKTYVPSHPVDNKDLWSSLYGQQLGVDEVASSAQRNHKQFYKERNECVQRLVGLGWKTYVNRKT
ncbi:MAG: glycosyltransferase [Candidatus Lokiarchaeota archaeon]|jgi:hypothetical protein|nr:glycosyltransferase [Candidatus Lokiarchaeota archaeon]